MHVTFVATRKNSDPTERELYEMDFLLRVLGLNRTFVDLGLQTIAACTPADVEVTLVDEYSEEIDYTAPTDLVALSAKTSCVTRAYEVARCFREQGRKVVLGGIHATLRPEEALEHVDSVVTGEAEQIWQLGGLLEPHVQDLDLVIILHHGPDAGQAHGLREPEGILQAKTGILEGRRLDEKDAHERDLLCARILPASTRTIRVFS
jgi:hypothetical protein